MLSGFVASKYIEHLLEKKINFAGNYLMPPPNQNTILLTNWLLHKHLTSMFVWSTKCHFLPVSLILYEHALTFLYNFKPSNTVSWQLKAQNQTLIVYGENIYLNFTFKCFTKRSHYIWWHPIRLGLKQLFPQFHKVLIWSKYQGQRASLPSARHRILADAWTFPVHLPAHTLWAVHEDCDQLILQDNDITDN